MSSHRPQIGSKSPTSNSVLTSVLANFTLHDASVSQNKSGSVIPVTISSHGHISGSILLDAGSSVTLMNEKLQRQLNLAATPLDSHYNLVWATGDSLTTLGTAQVDIVWDHEIWLTPAVISSALVHPLILGFNFFELTQSKINFETNKVEIGSKAYPSDVHCVKLPNSAITSPTLETYWPCGLLLDEMTRLVILAVLITIIILTAVATLAHCHLKPPFKKQHTLLSQNFAGRKFRESSNSQKIVDFAGI